MTPVVVYGAGAMGTAVALVHARAGLPVTLLGTRFDDATIQTCRGGDPHPALGITLPADITCVEDERAPSVLGEAGRLVLAVSSDGLADVVDEAARHLPRDVTWVVVTKGWDPASLRTGSEAIAHARPKHRVVTLAGPALARELGSGSPTAMVCASVDEGARVDVATTLAAAEVSVVSTDDVTGADTAAGYKNVAAIAVGMCEGLAGDDGSANARSAMFALAIADMARLAEARGGRAETVFGLAGVGDLYVTCLGGRNGEMGRRLGAGQSVTAANEAIGSTVEGVANTRVVSEIASRMPIELPTTAAVASVLDGTADPRQAVARALGALS